MKKSSVKAMAFDSEDTEVKEISKAEEAEGKLASQFDEDKLMKSVLSNDKQTIDDGKLIAESINQGISAFTPDLAFENITKNFTIAKQLYGEKLIRLLAGYNPNYIAKNLGIPEFQKELKTSIAKNIEELKDRKILDKGGRITEKGIELASLILYTEELDHILPKGVLGSKIHKKASHYGDKEDYRDYKKGDRYKDFAVRRSVRKAIRRGHTSIEVNDLQTYVRQSKGSIYVVYGLDASGSMKGKKIEMAKKAGIALAYKAISEKDKVGMVVFGSEVKDFVAPTRDFPFLLREITKVRASRQTEFTQMIKKAIEIFPREKATKHLILLTDALPTVGDKPEEETLKAVSAARSNGITVSIVGINLDRQGKQMAEKIAQMGEGRVYVVKNIENVDKIILEDYYSVI
jgi:Mg-chelatase subunit ChlD